MIRVRSSTSRISGDAFYAEADIDIDQVSKTRYYVNGRCYKEVQFFDDRILDYFLPDTQNSVSDQEVA